MSRVVGLDRVITADRGSRRSFRRGRGVWNREVWSGTCRTIETGTDRIGDHLFDLGHGDCDSAVFGAMQNFPLWGLADPMSALGAQPHRHLDLARV